MSRRKYKKFKTCDFHSIMGDIADVEDCEDCVIELEVGMSKSKFTLEDFENRLGDSNYHNVILVRFGSFVGIYRYVKENQSIRLWRKINNDSYVQRSAARVKDEGDYWGSGGSQGISAVISSNEAHQIPKGYDLDNRNHLQVLGDSLGGSHCTVKKRIEENNPTAQ